MASECLYKEVALKLVDQITFIVLVSSKNYYRRLRLIIVIVMMGNGRAGVWGEGLEGDFREEGLAPFIQSQLDVSTDKASTISSGNLFQYEATQTLNACWRRRVCTCRIDYR